MQPESNVNPRSHCKTLTWKHVAAKHIAERRPWFELTSRNLKVTHCNIASIIRSINNQDHQNSAQFIHRKRSLPSTEKTPWDERLTTSQTFSPPRLVLRLFEDRQLLRHFGSPSKTLRWQVLLMFHMVRTKSPPLGCIKKHQKNCLPTCAKSQPTVATRSFLLKSSVGFKMIWAVQSYKAISCWWNHEPCDLRRRKAIIWISRNSRRSMDIIWFHLRVLYTS